MDAKKCFRGFTNVSDNLDRKENIKMANGENSIAKVPQPWKKSFSPGVLIPQKMRKCSDCKKDTLCETCDKVVNQKKNSQLI